MMTTLTERGQISIPAELRQRLGLKAGDAVDWSQIGPDDLHLHIVRPINRPLGAKAMLGWARTFRATRSTQSWMDELREGEG